jgi:hypothetical protein
MSDWNKTIQSDEFKALSRTPAPEGKVVCSGCEGHPVFPNVPCAVCGASPVVPVGVSREEIALALLDANRNCELSHGCDHYDDDPEWRVHRVNGGRNDREWTLIGRGPTPADAIIAALRPTDTGWRDIATAPRDGTKIIGLTKRSEVYRVWWHEFEEGWDWQDDFDSEQQIVGWMPLPPAPTDTGRE